MITYKPFLQSPILKNINGMHHVAAIALKMTKMKNFARYLAPSHTVHRITKRRSSATTILLQETPNILKIKINYYLLFHILFIQLLHALFRELSFVNIFYHIHILLLIVNFLNLINNLSTLSIIH